MLLRRILALAVVLVAAAAPSARADDTDDTVCTCDVTPAACDASCACDSECEIDWSVDECSAPDAGCIPNAPEPDDASLDALESADVEAVDPPDWTPHADDVASTTQADVSGGCASGGTPGLLLGGGAVVALLVIARRRRALLALALAACAVGSDTWDDAVDNGPNGDTHTYLDVYAAELGDNGASQFLLASDTLPAGAGQPVAQFSLERAGGELPVYRTAGACGDRLVTSAADGAELLGWARTANGDGTAQLVELVAPDGCTYDYETDPDAIASLVADGYTQTAVIGQVWPPGLSDTPLADPPDDSQPLDAPACTVTRHSPVELLYASPGSVESLRFLLGCPGEVIIGEKHELGPNGPMTQPDAQARGGRTAFVLDRNGDKLRALLMRPNGVERTQAYLKHKLALGYDYIVIDEITAAPDFADGQTLNRRLRALLLRMPPRTILPYISIDLTQEAGGAGAMKARRLLLRAFKKRARMLALEVYMHTPEVMAGDAPAVFRRAADRLALAVRGLQSGGGINLRAISTIGTSMHSTFPQYRYLDEPSHDLSSIKRQVNAIRHGSKRLRQQHGIGWYFVNKSDMAPSGSYSYDALIRRMRTQALRFR